MGTDGADAANMTSSSRRPVDLLLALKLQNDSQKDWGTVYVSAVSVVVALGLRNIMKSQCFEQISLLLLPCREQKSKHWSGAL